MSGILFLMLVLALIVFLFTTIAGHLSRQEKSTESYYEIIDESSSPKIGATVSNVFYNEIKTYCQRHHMTMSNLIRKSVRSYMDENM